jgi:predicted membrane protein
MTTEEAGGLGVLVFMIAMIGGSLIWGLSFWFWLFLAVGIAIVVMVIVWIYTLLRGATRWAKRQ